MKIFIFALIAPMIFLNAIAFGHVHHDGAVPEEQSKAGFEERTGQIIPLDTVFFDEGGNRVKLGEVVKGPTIITFVYYQCSHVCPQMLAGLAAALGKLQFVPGRDYTVLTISFDETDTPELARSKKVNYMTAPGKPFPGNAWKFLTGDRKNIEKITAAAGIRVQRVPHGFIHPEVLVFVSPGGKITKYLHIEKYNYGAGYTVTFSTLTIESALAEAVQGRVSTGGRNVPLYCFHYAPAMQDAFLALSQIAGGTTLLIMAALFMFLRIMERGIRTKKHGR